MAESASHARSIPRTGPEPRTQDTSKNRKERSSSEHRKRKASKAACHRSRSSQPLGKEKFQKDVQLGKEKLLEFQQLLEKEKPQNVVRSPLQSNVYRFEESSLGNSFPNFFDRVNCPFCWEVLGNKIELVEHLGKNCRNRSSRNSKLYSIFQILPDNRIKCNVCVRECFATVHAYYLHTYDERHVFQCSIAKLEGKQLTDFLHCSNCWLKVPDNATQLQFHLQHKDHEIRRGLNKKGKTVLIGRYELCFYCGFSCSDLIGLSAHMRGRCDAINRIRMESIPMEKRKEVTDERKKEQKRTNEGETSMKSRSILIRGDVDVVELLKVLKNFGKINSIHDYDEEYLLVEFENETSIENISLVKNVLQIKNKKLCIKFLDDAEKADGLLTVPDQSTD